MGMPYGIQSMLKDGYKHMSGLEEAVFRNIDACKNLSQITRTSMGPNGMNKMVINHLDKLFVTSDASTIVQELEVQHPAAKLLVMAAKAQESEIGDGTNFVRAAAAAVLHAPLSRRSQVLALAGELLSNAEGILRDGLHTTDVADGYQKASEKALEALDALVLPGSEILDIRDKAAVACRLKGSVSSKQYGFEDTLTPLIAEACVDVCPKNPNNFNVDNVRVVKIPGSGLSSSIVVKGMVLKRDVEGTVKHLENVKVAVYAQGIDTAGTESKGTILIKNADELQNYAKTEENKLEEYIKGISSSGAQVVVSGSSIGEMAMHFIEKYGMMAVRIPSKFDLRRFCRATNSTALAKLVSPQPEELGFAKAIQVEEIGGANCIVIRQDASMGSIATIVLRGSTEGQLDDVERAVDDGVNAYKALCKDSRVVAGGGAAEVEITRRVSDFGKKQTGLDQYAIQKYAESFEVVTRTLAENSGHNATDVLSSLYAAHANGQVNAGLDIETGLPKDLTTEDIADVYLTKWWAIKLATDAVITILKVDQIIMAKQAGGPKARGPGGDDDE